MVYNGVYPTIVYVTQVGSKMELTELVRISHKLVQKMQVVGKRGQDDIYG